MQKQYHLLKYFTVYTTIGYVLAILCPFTPCDNDATIIQEVLQLATFLAGLLQKDNIQCVQQKRVLDFSKTIRDFKTFF